MTIPMENNQHPTNPIVNQTTEKVNPMTDLIAQFERAYTSGANYERELMELSTAIAASVVAKVYDPQRKSAQAADRPTAGGCNPVIAQLRRDVQRDSATLRQTPATAQAAYAVIVDADGNCKTVVTDRAALDRLNALSGDTLGDGADLVQTAALAVLEQAAEHAATGAGWMENLYTVKELSRRVYLRLDDTPQYKYVDTTPIQQVYRAVRRAVQDSRAVQTDPRSAYTYLSQYTDGEIDAVYYRSGKWADIGGGTVYDGRYRTPGAPAGYGGRADSTGDVVLTERLQELMDAMHLTQRQKRILSLRLAGHGPKAIATALGLESGNIKRTLRRMRQTCIDMGLADPDMLND